MICYLHPVEKMNIKGNIFAELNDKNQNRHT